MAAETASQPLDLSYESFPVLSPKQCFLGRNFLAEQCPLTHPYQVLPQPDIHLYLLSWLPRKVCCLLKLSSAWGTLTVEGKGGRGKEKKKNSRHMHTWQHMHKYNCSMALTLHKSVGLSGSLSWIFKCQSVRVTWGSFHNPVVLLSPFLQLAAEKKLLHKETKMLSLQCTNGLLYMG